MNTATPAMACFTNGIGIIEYEPTEEDIARSREECRQLHLGRDAAMETARNYDGDANVLISLAQGYESADYGCPDDPAYAFALTDTALASATPITAKWRLLIYAAGLLSEFDDLATPEHAEEIRDLAWLFTDTRFSSGLFRSPRSTALRNWSTSRERAVQLLSEPESYAAALQLFGNNSGRDAALLQIISDPQSAFYDRTLYAELIWPNYPASSVAQSGLLLRAASLHTDPQYGEPDPGIAREMLLRGTFTPYHRLWSSTDEQKQRASLLWQDIGQLLAASDNEEESARGESILTTGDPTAFDRQVPDNMPINAIVLQDFPEEFATFEWSRFAIRAADNYPRRAIRHAHAGPVETAMHYGADGQFVAYVVTRSSGSAVLDAGAIQSLTRYLRPRAPETLAPDMLDGRDVLITLPTIEYQLISSSGPEDSLNSSGRFEGNRLTLTASPIRQREATPSCY